MRARFAAKEGRCEAIEFVKLVELRMEIWRVEAEGEIFLYGGRNLPAAQRISILRIFSSMRFQVPPQHKLRFSSSPRRLQIK